MRAVYVDKVIPRLLAVKYLHRIWPGVVWSPLSHARMVDLPEPSLPDGRWIRVRNRQCGICETDLCLLFIDADVGIGPAALPGTERFFLGHEVVGDVVEVGSRVSRFKVGDKVVMESRFAGANCHTQEIDPPCRFCADGQTRLCENASLGLGRRGVGGGWGDGYTAHESEVWPAPDDLDDDQAALIEPMAVALHGVLRRPPRSGEHALVIGAGIIGLLTVQAVKVVAPECHLTVLARYPHQADAARRFGADEVIGESGDVYAEVARVTGAKLYRAPLNRGMILGGFEVIYDCVGKADTLGNALRWARASGTVVMIGIDLRGLKVDLNPIWYQEVDLIGSHTFGLETWRGRRLHTFDLVVEMLQEGALSHKGLITHRFPLDEYQRAIETAMDKSTGSIKVMLTMGDGLEASR